MSLLFTPLHLPSPKGGLTLPNRIVVAPMCQYQGRDGCATDWHLMHWGHLLNSGAAVVTLEATAVFPEGRAICCTSSCHRWPISTRMPMAARSRTFCALRWRCLLPFAANLTAYPGCAGRHPTGSKAVGTWPRAKHCAGYQVPLARAFLYQPPYWRCLPRQAQTAFGNVTTAQR